VFSAANVLVLCFKDTATVITHEIASNSKPFSPSHFRIGMVRLPPSLHAKQGFLADASMLGNIPDNTTLIGGHGTSHSMGCTTESSANPGKGRSPITSPTTISQPVSFFQMTLSANSQCKPSSRSTRVRLCRGLLVPTVSLRTLSDVTASHPGARI
jgi:hypothetical protein